MNPTKKTVQKINLIASMCDETCKSDTTYQRDPKTFGNGQKAEFVLTSMATEETHTLSH